MSQEANAPQLILDHILEGMFPELEKIDQFNPQIIEKLRKLADTDSLVKNDKLLNLLKEQGDSGENP